MEAYMEHKDKQGELYENIKESGGVVAKGESETIHCLSIVGQIEGHYILPDGQKSTKYEHLIPLLVAIEQDTETDGLLILLNTMGGDVEAGLAIAEVIASMTKPTASVVLGGGHSIGVPLAVAAKRSFIVPSATMTIHPVRVNGLVVGAPQTYTYFSQMQKRIINFICDHSKANADQINELMMRPDMIATDVGSVIEGKEAVEYGLIDAVGGIDTALGDLKSQIRAKRQSLQNG
ncbi:MAG: ATP-dependent Clp protease proteolytic subunit [Clostridia bacterium]|nr:ATP-dependent Clp protease proteolytic subunit [Clostridia bacterium]